MDWISFFENWIWFGCAATGFAILFNVPKRTLIAIFFMGALGGSVKLLIVHWNNSVVLGTLLGAAIIGFLSIYAAHFRHSPPFVFAIPAVIPMVPGSYAYNTMKGIIRLTNNTGTADFVALLNETVTKGLLTLFVLMAIAVGVVAPMLLTRRDSAKEIKVPLPHFKQEKTAKEK
ncbi:MAG TPA: threonine/serine exporter family protein [Flavobacteriaceae bacterium]|nr:threonine/serine exporter family protein [Flavobacteriaceae bacterium]